MHSPDKDRMSHHKVESGDHAGLLALIERIRERARGRWEGAGGGDCYELATTGFWLHRLLLLQGSRTCVRFLQDHGGSSGTRRAKTDRIDGEQMLRPLMAYCAVSHGWCGRAGAER